ncbi:MAG: hypothetical protein M3P08_10455 [Thermoproteota archaeon]|nr:hypothetical protein [Thermoproteota archaeon]
MSFRGSNEHELRYTSLLVIDCIWREVFQSASRIGYSRQYDLALIAITTLFFPATLSGSLLELGGRGINWVEFGHGETRFSSCYKISILSDLVNRGCKSVWCYRSRGKRISCGSSSKRFWSNDLHVQNYDYKDLEQIGEHMSKQNSIVCATYFGVYTEGTEFISNSRCIDLS